MPLQNLLILLPSLLLLRLQDLLLTPSWRCLSCWQPNEELRVRQRSGEERRHEVTLLQFNKRGLESTASEYMRLDITSCVCNCTLAVNVKNKSASEGNNKKRSPTNAALISTSSLAVRKCALTENEHCQLIGNTRLRSSASVALHNRNIACCQLFHNYLFIELVIRQYYI
jgi:hypothetical protein